MAIPGYTALAAASRSTHHHVAARRFSPASIVVPQLRRRGGAVAGTIGSQVIGGRLGFECSSTACTCQGDRDCNDLYSTGLCGDVGVCGETGCWCLRF